jgi:hypothetical protein
MDGENPSNLANIHSQSELRKYNDGLKISYTLEPTHDLDEDDIILTEMEVGSPVKVKSPRVLNLQEMGEEEEMRSRNINEITLFPKQEEDSRQMKSPLIKKRSIIAKKPMLTFQQDSQEVAGSMVLFLSRAQPKQTFENSPR